MTLGQKLRAARLEQRLTQEQLGGRELSKSYVSELERGHRTPRLATLKILARRLRRPLSYFLDGATEDQEPEAFLRVGLAFAHARCLAQAAVWFKRAADALSDDHDEQLHARIELAVAVMDQRLGHDLRAWRRVERVLPVLSRAVDKRALIRAHVTLGLAKTVANDLPSAAWSFEAALQLLPTAESDPSAAAMLYYHLGVVRERMGQKNEAAEAFRKAIEVAEPFADSQLAAAYSLDRAVEAANEGAFETAIAYAGEATALLETLEHKRQLAEIHWHMGDQQARAEHWEEAHRQYVTGLVFYAAARQPCAAARACGTFIEALQARMPMDVAHALADIALTLFPEDSTHGDTVDENRAGTLWLRGTVERLRGRTSDARALLTRSLRQFELLRKNEEIKTIRRELLLLAVDCNDLASAREYLTTLHETTEEYRLRPLA